MKPNYLLFVSLLVGMRDAQIGLIISRLKLINKFI